MERRKIILWIEIPIWYWNKNIGIDKKKVIRSKKGRGEEELLFANDLEFYLSFLVSDGRTQIGK